MSRIRTAAAALALAAFVSVLAGATTSGPGDSGWGTARAGGDDSGWGLAPVTTDARPVADLRI
ncbi:hypothetical protein [Streptomyces sp. NPDC020742]|uniref:hypothetical protein n=1 Tax=Streptomyces sp. NPDC020742 TaxID=3154897 RepID=UPI0033EB4B51